MGGALFVADQDVVYPRVQQLIIERYCNTSRITEDDVYTLPFEQIQNRLGTFHELIPHHFFNTEDVQNEHPYHKTTTTVSNGKSSDVPSAVLSFDTDEVHIEQDI